MLDNLQEEEKFEHLLTLPLATVLNALIFLRHKNYQYL